MDQRKHSLKKSEDIKLNENATTTYQHLGVQPQRLQGDTQLWGLTYRENKGVMSVVQVCKSKTGQATSSKPRVRKEEIVGRNH